ncbi:MAG: FHA domain-containing protein [Lentimicrobiaceae bacterium]|jgi:pSer/pThr/pTyr-binding forkhead associated (FHA) protein
MKSTIKIGRDKSNDIQINEPRISRNHAIITDLGDGTYEIKDLGSTNGTFVNGERITQKIITASDKVEVASCLVNWYVAINEPVIPKTETIIQEEPFAKIVKTISIGSSLENDIVLSKDFVSNRHATISVLKNGNYYICDLESSNGTYINGTKVKTKNFTKTDIVKIASEDLPQNWFQHKNLQSHLFRDHKKAWLISAVLIIIIAASVLIFFNRCKWFDCGCNLTAQQIYLKNKNSIVHIVHDYYYTIEFEGKTYFVGKNRTFKVTEANTSKENLLPYNSTSGSGCFVNKDGTILTSVFIVNPWLNESERNEMLQEVLRSKTINKFSLDKEYRICGETAELKWLAEGLVNNNQNYIAATSKISCILTDSSSSTIQSIKKEIPENANVVDLNFDTLRDVNINKASMYYYSKANLMSPVSTLQDTFYAARDSFNIYKMNTALINKLLPELPEGSIVINERGKLVGNIQQNNVIFIHRYYKQLTK